MLNNGADYCPLCTSLDVECFYTDRQRHYLRCAVCALIFVPRCFHLTAEQERRRYDNHENSPNDPGYRQFLQRIMLPLLAELAPGRQGLDFGCGPGPTLSLMLQAHGHSMALYDPFYAADGTVLQQCYDFITCTEAIEHFTHPAVEWRRLLDLLRSGGILAIMTGLYDDQLSFADWYYKNDPTHIGFFSKATFTWLAQRDALTTISIDQSVVLLRKG